MHNHPSNEHPIESRGSDSNRNQPAVIGRAHVPTGNMVRLSEIDGPTVRLPQPAHRGWNGPGYVSRRRYSDVDRNTNLRETAATWLVQ